VAAVLLSRTAWALLLAPVLACARTGGETSISVDARLEVQEPERGLLLDGQRITVRGRVSDPQGTEWVRVEDRTVLVDDDGSFELTMTLAPGLNRLQTVARLDDGTEVVDTRAVMAGTLADAQATAERGLRAQLSPQTLGTLGDAVARSIADTDWQPIIAKTGPVANTGSGCFRAAVNVDDLEIGSASMQTTPITGGLEVQLVLYDVAARASSSYEAACIEGHTSVGFTADRYFVHANVKLSAVDGDVRSTVEVLDSDIDDFAIVYTGVDFIDEALTNVDFIVGPVLGWIIEARLGPALETVIEEVAARDTTLTLSDTELVVRTYPETLTITPEGAHLEVGTSTFVPGSSGPGYPVSAVDTPIAAQPAAAQGFDLRITDEVFNQALAALWSSPLLHQSVAPQALGSPDFGGAVDSIAIDAKLPPVVKLGEQGELPTLVIGDLIVELQGKDYTHARVAISAEIAFNVVDRPDLGPGVTILEPDSEVVESWVDVIEVDDRSRPILDEALVEVLIRSVVEHTASELGEKVGFIALPSFAGTTLVGPHAFTRPGYLQLEGQLGVAP